MRRSILLCVLMALLCSISVTATAPRLVNYQGRLTDPGGNPVPNGTYSVLFTIYGEPSGDPLSYIWSETQNVTTSDGLFSVLLGSVSPIYPSTFSDTSCYLGIKVGSDPQMTPLSRIASVPYAMSASSGSGWTLEGSNVITSAFSYPVGIGLVTPQAMFHVNDFNSTGIAGRFVSALGSGNPSYGVYGEATGVGSNFGGKMNASGGTDNTGLQASVVSSGTGYGFGVVSYCSGSGTSTNYGIYTQATGGAQTYGVWARVGSGATNYAGYFTKGSAGSLTPAPNSVVIMENSVNSYLSILAPDIYEKGILFGQPANEAAGGIIYNAGGVSNGFSFRTVDNSTKVVITEFGAVGIGTTAPTQKLQVNGSICYTGSIAACSDVRYKREITGLSGSLDRVLQMRGVTYKWNQDEYPDQDFDQNVHLGFLAQEIEQLYPELVLTDPDGYKSVDYSRLTPVLVEAIKEQQQQLDAQQERIDELTALVTQLARQTDRSQAAYGSKQ